MRDFELTERARQVIDKVLFYEQTMKTLEADHQAAIKAQIELQKKELAAISAPDAAGEMKVELREAAARIVDLQSKIEACRQLIAKTRDRATSLSAF